MVEGIVGRDYFPVSVCPIVFVWIVQSIVISSIWIGIVFISVNGIYRVLVSGVHGALVVHPGLVSLVVGVLQVAVGFLTGVERCLILTHSVLVLHCRVCRHVVYLTSFLTIYL